MVREALPEIVKQPNLIRAVEMVNADSAQAFVKSFFDSRQRGQGLGALGDPLYPRHIAKLFSCTVEAQVSGIAAQFENVQSVRSLVSTEGSDVYKLLAKSTKDAYDGWRRIIDDLGAHDIDRHPVSESSTVASHS
eukprot:6465630-Amphidinium_carterae.1